jgi:uncharacterized protein DUF6151
MPALPTPRLTSSCVCGSVVLETFGPPIVAVACHCTDCQAAGRQIEALASPARVLDSNGGTVFLLFRKDRMRPAKSADLLRGLKLKPSSATSRYIATCCNAMMYLGFDDSKHWVSMNRDRFQGDVPAVRMRICTRSVSSETLPTDLPCYPGYPMPFIARLMLTRLAMLVGSARKAVHSRIAAAGRWLRIRNAAEDGQRRG